jgi:hypothetical protein
MSQPKLIYRTDGEWMAILCDGNLFDTLGEWIGWLEDDAVYSLEGEYVGYISEDGRLLRPRVLPYRQRRRPPEQPPRFQSPPSVPLPPLFGELGYDVVDVFEETPDIFGLVSDLHPDAGEESFSEGGSVPFRQQLTKEQREALEKMVLGMIQSYRTTEPPVPVEAIATGLRPSQASSVETAPAHDRLQLAERTIERLGHSLWAVERGYCGPEGFTPAQVQYAARALLMPRTWLLDIPKALLRPWALAHRYAVSEETATLRLYDLSLKF